MRADEPHVKVGVELGARMRSEGVRTPTSVAM
jgi:hypothetical protein